MTTRVLVSALHGWPVDVTPVTVGCAFIPAGDKVRVPAGEEREFHVHSGQDLLIHEVQPGESDVAGGHDPLPVAGYTDQDAARVQLVNANKLSEEYLLRSIDVMQSDGSAFDSRWLAIARTGLEQAFMALNRAIFRPGRVKLPGDPQ